MKPAKRIGAHGLRFIGEQRGASEQDLKSALVSLFEAESGVVSAYLVRMSNAGQDSIASGLRTIGAETKVIKAINSVFSSLFVRGQHLDIIILDGRSEQDVAKVCAPFYRRLT